MTYIVYDTPKQLLQASGASRGTGKVWRGGSVLFTQAASDATDHHVTNAAGVKFYVDLSQDWIDVQAFGVFPTNTPAQNTAALLAMTQVFIDTDNNRHWKIRFPAGTYQYDNSSWAAGVRHLTIEGYGAWLQALTDNVYQLPLGERGVFDDDEGGRSYRGHEIETVAIGDTTITFKTAGDESNFTAGDRVLLMSSQNMFYGYPPNCAKFQYCRVASVGTGTLVIDQPSRYNFKDDDLFAPDGTYINLGKARILNLDRTGQGRGVFAETRIYRGFGLKDNPGHTSENEHIGVNMTGNYVLWEDIIFDHAIELWPSFAQFAHARNLRTVGSGKIRAEIDKLLETCIFEGFTMHEKANGGTGVQNMIYRDMVLTGETANTCLSTVLYDRCEIMAPVASYGNQGRGSVAFRDCTIYVPDGEYAVAGGSIGSGDSPSSIPDANTLRFPTDQGEAVRILREGSIIYASDYSDIGVIQSMSQTSTNLDLTIDWFVSNTPATEKTYITPRLSSVMDLGGNKIVGGNRMFQGTGSFDVTGRPSSDAAGMRATLSNFYGPSAFVGAASRDLFTLFNNPPRMLRRVTVDVIQPYRGSSTGVILRLVMPGGTLVVDAMTAGKRIFDVNGNTGLESGDSGTLPSGWTPLLTVFLQTGSVQVPDYTNGDRDAPYIAVDVEYFVPGHRP